MQHDLNDTLMFVRVVQEGSFIAASRSLRLPKTTLSRKLQELEARLGTRLLHRTTRKLSLTEAGSVFLEHAQRVEAELKEAHSAVEQLNRPRGWLRISAPHSFAVRWITPLLGEFHTRYPEVQVELMLGHEPLDLLSKEIDIALRLGPLADSSLVARRLAVFRMHVYASAAYLARHGEPEHPEQLLDHQALALPLARRGSQYAWNLRQDTEDARQAYPIRPVLVASDPEALYGPLLEGMGLMLTMGVNMQQHLAAGTVRQVLPAWVGPEPEFNAVFPLGHGRSPKVRAFVDFLLERLHFTQRI